MSAKLAMYIMEFRYHTLLRLMEVLIIDINVMKVAHHTLLRLVTDIIIIFTKVRCLVLAVTAVSGIG